MTRWRLLHEIDCNDLRPACQGGSGASLLAILSPPSEARLPLWRELALALACAWRNVRRGSR